MAPGVTFQNQKLHRSRLSWLEAIHDLIFQRDGPIHEPLQLVDELDHFISALTSIYQAIQCLVRIVLCCRVQTKPIFGDVVYPFPINRRLPVEYLGSIPKETINRQYSKEKWVVAGEGAIEGSRK